MELLSYTPRFRIQRLRYVTEKATGEGRISACKQLLSELRTGADILLYAKTLDEMEEILASLGSEFEHDRGQLEQSLTASNKKYEQLETDLMRVKLASNKEAIRLAYLTISDFQHQCGQLNDSLKLLTKVREYCLTPSHFGELYQRMIYIFLETRDYKQVHATIAKVEALVDVESDEMLTSTMNVFKALVALSENRYKDTSKYLLKIHGDSILIQNLSHGKGSVLSARDITVYATLTAVVSLDRSELRELVIENQDFRILLESYPVIHKLAKDFFNKRYTEVFRILDGLTNDLQLDVLIGPHISNLVALLTEKTIVDYLIPYECVNLAKMKEAFGRDLELTLVDLIGEKKLAARIDSANNTLWKLRQTTKDGAIEKVLALALVHGKETRRGLLRLSLVEHGFCVHGKEKHLLSLATREPEAEEPEPDEGEEIMSGWSGERPAVIIESSAGDRDGPMTGHSGDMHDVTL
jgi:COP9 signalosome complex subunit 1